MNRDLILAIDQGTTGSTAMFLDISMTSSPTIVAKATVEFPQRFPNAGWVEHDLNDIWNSVQEAIKNASLQVRGESALKRITSIGITNQRETICFFDRASSRPLANAIVWQCRRSTALCEDLKNRGLEAKVREKTGLRLDPYFSGSKILWQIKNNSNIRDQLNCGKAIIGTIDTWLLHKLTQQSSFCTEASNASRTLLFNIHQLNWDQDLLKIFEIPTLSCLPEIKSSASTFGFTKGLDFLPDGIPITGILGDQQAALAGQTCFDTGEAKCTYGTGAFLLVNAGSKCMIPKGPILSTIAWTINEKPTYALEGSCFISGAAVQFMRDQFKFIDLANQTESMALQGSGAPELYFVPALAGLGAPWWNPHARGAIFGMHRGTTINDIVRATLEGIALQVYDLSKSMEQELGHSIQILRADGGAAANNFLMQFQSNLLNAPVDRPLNIESTSLGAAYFSALGAKIFNDLNELRNIRCSERIFNPNEPLPQVSSIERIKKGWLKAVQAVNLFSELD
jgi:glycerol kinase